MNVLKSIIKFFSRDVPYIILIATLYLFITLCYLKTHSYIGTDGCVYAIGTENIASGNGFTRYGKPLTVYMPLYSYVSAPFYFAFENSETACRFVSILSALLSIPFLFYLVKTLFNVNVARIASLLIFTNTHYMKISSDVLVEGLFVLLLLISVYVYVSWLWFGAMRKTPILFSTAIFSLTSGLATLTRPDAFFIFAGLLLFYFFIKRESLNIKIVTVITGVVIFLLVLVPQLSFQYAHTGKIQLTNKVYGHLLSGDFYAFSDTEGYYKKGSFKIYDTLGLPLPPDLKRIPESSQFSALEYLMKNKAQLIKRSYNNTIQFIKYLDKGIMFSILWCFVFIGALILLRKKELRPKLVFLVLFFVPVGSLILLHFELRYVLPQILILLILTAVGIDHLLMYLKQKNKKICTVIFAAIILALVYYPFADNYHYIKDVNEPNRYQMYKKAGYWLKRQLDEPARYYAVATKPWVCYYAGVQCETLPWVDSVGTLVKYLKKINADFLIVQKKQIKGKRETLISLLDENKKIPGLTPIYNDKNKKDKIVIYKVE
ncbi:glycosyltransferase family 39 protein [candidate division WOR-3 bacterium]|nr:glycosyltransferase family 39 protein [candidate division WOR-3 bacterium]